MLDILYFGLYTIIHARMNTAKKILKEAKLVSAAEEVFAKLGFKNAKMEDIAAAAGITKVTLYSYFQSKENLYMAVTYNALQSLIDKYYETIDNFKGSPGIESSNALVQCFMEFCEDNYLYSEALLEYFALIRSSSNGEDETKMPEALKESIYFQKIKNIHNLPFKLAAQELERGVKDGSIHPDIDIMVHTLHGWSVAVGYAKLISASGENKSPIFNINLEKIKSLNLQLTRSALNGAVKLA